MRLVVRFCFVLTGFLLVQSAGIAATLEEMAKTEAEVVLYSSLNNEQIVTLVDAFKKKYPFIKPSFYRATSERVLQRAMTEAKAGRFAVDVFTSAGFQLELLKESGLTQKYVPAEASAYEDGFQGSRWTLDECPLAAGHDGVQHTARPAGRGAEKI